MSRYRIGSDNAVGKKVASNSDCITSDGVPILGTKKWRTEVRHSQKLQPPSYCCSSKYPSVSWLGSVSIAKILVVSMM